MAGQSNIINSPGNEIPDNTIIVVPERNIKHEDAMLHIKPLIGNIKRDWFNSHFYYCLPLNIGNQYGFVITAASDFSVTWDGGDSVDATTVDGKFSSVQTISSHFGSGIVTIQNSWHFRTPPGVNLMTIAPPNFVQPGIMHMTGVVETDNLRRDFTFNLKITERDRPIHFKVGDPVGAFIPVQRYFVDGFSIKAASDLFTQDQIQNELDTGKEFARLRSTEDVDKNHQAGRLYFKGEDAWGNQFDDHQKTMI